MKNHTADHSNSTSHKLLESTIESAEETIVEARNRVKSALEAAGETVSRVKERAVEGAKKTDKMIRNKPYQAMGIAFGVGALVGFLLSRRNKNS
jgi:ElaB/YqjD/DUF883 family membrane-anchored ribosome-binding protein